MPLRAVNDALLVLARDAQASPLADARRHKDRIVPLVPQRGRIADGAVQPQFNAQRHDVVDIPLQNGLGQAVLWDSDAHHAASHR